ncbi:MAG: ABC transporter substrate-binding protein [Acidobacteriota bacterium]
MATLRIALRNYADFENAMAEEARLFEAAHAGVGVELVSVGIHELHQRAIVEGGLRDGEFDLALLVTDWLAEACAAGAVEDLHPWHARTPLQDWPDGWARSLVEPVIVNGTLSSIPWHDGPECLVYRSDLFHDSGRRRIFREEFGRELTPPRTWEEFHQTARFFTDPAAGLYGTVFAGFPDGHNTVYDFALQVWSRGGELVARNGRPQLNTAEAREAVEFYRTIVRDAGACHPRSPQLDSTQSGDAFMAGEVAMMANWFGFAARAGRPGSPLAGKVAIAPIPAAPGTEPVSLSVFWPLAMGSGSRNKDLAWEFLRFVASPERDLGITRHGAVAVRLSSWRNAALQAEIPAYREIERISLGARQLPQGEKMSAFASLLDTVMACALGSSEPTEAILEEAQDEIERKDIRF